MAGIPSRTGVVEGISVVHNRDADAMQACQLYGKMPLRTNNGMGSQCTTGTRGLGKYSFTRLFDRFDGTTLLICAPCVHSASVRS